MSGRPWFGARVTKHREREFVYHMAMAWIGHWYAMLELRPERYIYLIGGGGSIKVRW